MDDPKTRINLRSGRIGRVGGDQAESTSRVRRKGLASSVTSFVIIHLENLGVVSGRRECTRVALDDIRRHSQPHACSTSPGVAI